MSAQPGAPVAFGPELLEDGRARFRLWAPSLESLQLEVAGVGSLPMQPQAEGWFELVTRVSPGARYRFRIDENLAVPDPASHYQPEHVHGYSELIDHRHYAWRYPDWCGRPWNEVVIYELHVGACGGYEALQAQLPRLAKMGITAIELMPLADCPGTRAWGYDGVLPYAPSAAYGRPEQLKALIDAAHGLKLLVYLDVVYNHFGPEGNYLASYAGDFFRDDRQTPWGAAIDFRRPQVRQFFIQNALYWLEEYRFDGLRLDAVHAIDEPGFLDELAATVRQRFGSTRQVHLMLENENNQARHLERDFDAQWNDDAHNVLHVLLTGEGEGYYANYLERPAEKLARCLAEGFVYQGEAFPSHEGRSRGTPSAHLPPTRFIFFLQNHDQIGNRAMGERLSTLAHPQALRAAITLQLLCPQTPLLFMGEEWGSRTPFLFFTDFHDELAEAVRRGRRNEFKRFSAFADEATRARIPDPNDPTTFERSMPDFNEAEQGEHAQILAFYQRLLSLRHLHLCLRLEGTRTISSAALSSQAVAASWVLGDGSRLQIFSNFGAEEISIEAVDSGLLFESRDAVAAAIAQGRLPGYCSCVFLEEALA